MEELCESSQKGQHHQQLLLKLAELEAENRRLLLAQDDSSQKAEKHDKTVRALKAEIDNLRAVLDATHRKCSEAEEKEAKAMSGFKERDDAIIILQDEKNKLENELKWKSEQFKHLEEAHQRQKQHFQTSKEEWEVEKSSLLSEVSKLEAAADQSSEVDGLRAQLKKFKEALAHEESRRKNLEMQLSETKAQLEKLSDQCWEAKSRIQCSDSIKNDEISELRDSLRAKEVECRELEHEAKKLEAENRDLLRQLREEAQFPRPPAATPPPPSVTKLRSKLRSLEQTHKDCLVTLKAKEAEWSSQLEKTKKELDDHRFESKIRDASMKELKEELEGCNLTITQLKMQNEELSLMLQLLKSDFPDRGTELIMRGNDEVEEMEHRHQSMLMTVKLEEEVKKYKMLLDESSKEKDRLKTQAEKLEKELRDELREVHDELERLDFELSESICRRSQVEIQLKVWRWTSERLKIQLEESKLIRKEMEASLIAQAEFEGEMKLEMEGLKDMLAEKDIKKISIEISPPLVLNEDENATHIVTTTTPSTKASHLTNTDDGRLPFGVIN